MMDVDEHVWNPFLIAVKITKGERIKKDDGDDERQ
jgi:hypothetical protein